MKKIVLCLCMAIGLLSCSESPKKGDYPVVYSIDEYNQEIIGISYDSYDRLNIITKDTISGYVFIYRGVEDGIADNPILIRNLSISEVEMKKFK